jgi:hypothetical protein
MASLPAPRLRIRKSRNFTSSQMRRTDNVEVSTTATPKEIRDLLTGDRPQGADVLVRDAAVRLANRTPRRSFLGLVGRASFATLGGSFLTLLWQESASATHCRAGPPATCLCSNARGSNACYSCDCKGGYWLTCNCTNPRRFRRYRDCCANRTCCGSCRTPSGCSNPICCNESPYCHSCHPAESCGSQQTITHCVLSSCTSIAC